MLKLEWDAGTLLLRGGLPPPLAAGFFKYDPRVKCYRSLAIQYRWIIETLKFIGVQFEDNVFQLPVCRFPEAHLPLLRDYQREALEAWKREGRGVIVLPTGAGKTLVAIAAIAELGVPALIVVPTLELIDQWEEVVKRHLGLTPSRYGGGERELSCVTIATYDSAYINVERLGNKFELIILDEVHHLPSPGYRQIAEFSAAPFRMGLTATPEREDELHLDLPYLVGPVVYRKYARELAGKWLAEFDIVRLYVNMSESEREEYAKLTSIYRAFLRKKRLRMRGPKDFEKLAALSVKDPEAREALLSWYRARRIALHASMKLDILRDILAKHRGDKVLIFTEHSDVVRAVSSHFLVPEITYRTPDEERKTLMSMFKEGRITTLVTSKVLEEGVDVPDANVAVILSGSGSGREFVQRLGRILRPKEGKRAILYEVVTSGTKEVKASSKRRKGVGA
ncbi:MAG: DEAD/DEAH box helicase family protein [Thermofilaceae archaeon]